MRRPSIRLAVCKLTCNGCESMEYAPSSDPRLRARALSLGAPGAWVMMAACSTPYSSFSLININYKNINRTNTQHLTTKKLLTQHTDATHPLAATHSNARGGPRRRACHPSHIPPPTNARTIHGNTAAQPQHLRSCALNTLVEMAGSKREAVWRDAGRSQGHQRSVGQRWWRRRRPGVAVGPET